MANIIVKVGDEESLRLFVSNPEALFTSEIASILLPYTIVRGGDIFIEFPKDKYAHDIVSEAYTAYRLDRKPKDPFALALYVIIKAAKNVSYSTALSYSEYEIVSVLRYTRKFAFIPIPESISSAYVLRIDPETMLKMLDLLGISVEGSAEAIIRRFYYTYFMPVKSIYTRGPLTVLNSRIRRKELAESPRLYSTEFPDDLILHYRISRVRSCKNLRECFLNVIPARRDLNASKYVIHKHSDMFRSRKHQISLEDIIREVVIEKNVDAILKLSYKAAIGAPSEYHAFYINVAAAVKEVTEKLIDAEDARILSMVRTKVKKTVPIPIRVLLMYIELKIMSILLKDAAKASIIISGRAILSKLVDVYYDVRPNVLKKTAAFINDIRGKDGGILYVKKSSVVYTDHIFSISLSLPNLLKKYLTLVGYQVPKGSGSKEFGYLTEAIYALAYPDPFKGILFEGDPGTGKTYLAEKFAEALRRYPELRLAYLISLGASQMFRSIRTIKTIGYNAYTSYVSRFKFAAYTITDLVGGDASDVLEDAYKEAVKELKGGNYKILLNDEPSAETAKELIKYIIKGKGIDDIIKDLERLIDDHFDKIKSGKEFSRDVVLLPAYIFGIKGRVTGEDLKKYREEQMPYVNKLYPSESLRTGVHFEKYVCGREDEFSKIFGYRDIAKIAITANVLGGTRGGEDPKEVVEKMIDVFHDAIYGSFEGTIGDRIERLVKFFRRSAFGKARLFPGISVMLIDEADKMSESAEVQLFEILDRAYVTIDYFGMLPRMGTVITILTSNRVREFSKPFKRRSNYVTFSREDIDIKQLREIIMLHFPPEIIAGLLNVRPMSVTKAIDTLLNEVPRGTLDITIDEIIDAIRATIIRVSEGSVSDITIVNAFKQAFDAIKKIKIIKDREE